MSNRLYTVSTLGIDLLSILGFITFPKEVFYYNYYKLYYKKMFVIALYV